MPGFYFVLYKPVWPMCTTGKTTIYNEPQRLKDIYCTKFTIRNITAILMHYTKRKTALFTSIFLFSRTAGNCDKHKIVSISVRTSLTQHADQCAHHYPTYTLLPKTKSELALSRSSPQKIMASSQPIKSRSNLQRDAFT